MTKFNVNVSFQLSDLEHEINAGNFKEKLQKRIDPQITNAKSSQISERGHRESADNFEIIKMIKI